jgi:hypothetical protein
LPDAVAGGLDDAAAMSRDGEVDTAFLAAVSVP